MKLSSVLAMIPFLLAALVARGQDEDENNNSPKLPFVTCTVTDHTSPAGAPAPSGAIEKVEKSVAGELKTPNLNNAAVGATVPSSPTPGALPAPSSQIVTANPPVAAVGANADANKSETSFELREQPTKVNLNDGLHSISAYFYVGLVRVTLIQRSTRKELKVVTKPTKEFTGLDMDFVQPNAQIACVNSK